MKNLDIHIGTIEKPTQIEDFAIWGSIYIENGMSYFPCQEWYDAVSSVLSLWLQETVRYISSGCNGECELFFMDGPFKIILFSKNRNTFAAFFERDIKIGEAELIDFAAFTRQLVSTSFSFINFFPEPDNIRAVSEVKHLAQELDSLIKK